MKLRQLFEQQRKVAVAAFGRMNPPTIGHEKLVNKIKSVDGDHYLFLSQTQKPKDNPLPFDVKLEFSKKFFPGVNVGHPTVRTPIQMLQMLEKLGYTDVVYVAGSDRVESFEKLFNDYNGKEYNFDSIKVISAGERDPDADGAEGMSASKMRAAAASGDYEAFAQGVPTPALAQKLYDAVRMGMGVKDTVPAESLEEKNLTELFDTPYPYNLNIGQDRAEAIVKLPDGTNLRVGFLKSKTRWDMAFSRDGSFDADEQGDQYKVLSTVIAVFMEFVNKVKPAKITFDADKDSTGSRVDVYTKMLNRYANKMGYDFTVKNPEGDSILQYTLTKKKSTAEEEQFDEAAYKGNLGLMELFAFFSKAEKTDPDLVAKVKSLIKQGQDKQVWRIVQDYTGTKLVGKEFEGSIAEAIIERACKSKRKSRG